MQKSLMIGLDEQNLEAVIHTYNLKDYYYPTLFPLKETNRLDWKMLEAQAGLRIAADLVSRGASIPRKMREAINRIQGDIPKISISRIKDEDELTEYDIMVAMAGGNPNLKALVEFWAEDTKFCWEGIAARAEWIALKQISLGKVKFTNSNNAAIVTEYDVDYQIPSNHKVGVSKAFSTNKGTPLSEDIPNAIKLGESEGIDFKYMFMNKNTFLKFVSQEEVTKTCKASQAALLGATGKPNLAMVNEYFTNNAELYNGMQVVLIDQKITLELADGSRTTSNPFEDDVILFSESKVLGNTYWKRPIDAKKMPGSVAEKVMYGHTLIKKYSTASPVTEVTEGISNLFPAWNLAGRSLLMQTSETAWNK